MLRIWLLRSGIVLVAQFAHETRTLLIRAPCIWQPHAPVRCDSPRKLLGEFEAFSFVKCGLGTSHVKNGHYFHEQLSWRFGVAGEGGFRRQCSTFQCLMFWKRSSEVELATTERVQHGPSEPIMEETAEVALVPVDECNSGLSMCQRFRCWEGQSRWTGWLHMNDCNR